MDPPNEYLTALSNIFCYVIGNSLFVPAINISLRVLTGWEICPNEAIKSAIPCTVVALFLLLYKKASIPFPVSKSTIEMRSQALSIANPAPWAMFGAVAFAASPTINMLLCLLFQGNSVTPFILRISVRRMKFAGVIYINSFIGIGPFQCPICLNIHFFCYYEQTWLPIYSLNPFLLRGTAKNQKALGYLSGTYPNLFYYPQL